MATVITDKEKIVSIAYISRNSNEFMIEFEDNGGRHYRIPLSYCEFPVNELASTAICALAVLEVEYWHHDGFIEYKPIVKKIIGQTFDN